MRQTWAALAASKHNGLCDASHSVISARPELYLGGVDESVFLLDVLQCQRCGGRMKILAAVLPPDATTKILECLGLPSHAPPLAPAIPDFAAQIDSF